MTSANNPPSISPPSYEDGGSGRYPIEITLASWVDRFLAWLVDFIIVSIGLGVLFALIALPFWFYYYNNDMTLAYKSIEPLHYIISSLAFFGYWTYFEASTGQSIGKKLLKIKTTDLSGKSIDAKSAAIESFGKAFLLPLDVLLGWIFTNDKRQRIFNRIGGNIVIKLSPKEGEAAEENIRYTKD